MVKKRDWALYNQHLIERGSLEFFLDVRLLRQWKTELRRQNNGKVGRPFEYTDSFIKMLHQIKSMFHLGYRQLQGFASSITKLMLGADIPHFTTMQKRLAKLQLQPLEGKLEPGSVVAIDSTGVKVVNSGEWVSRHGKKKHWVKLHVAVDIKNHRFVAAAITKENVADTTQFPLLVRRLARRAKISKVLADAAYDSDANFHLLEELGIGAGIRLRKQSIGRRLKGKRSRRNAVREQFGVKNRRSKSYLFRGMAEAQEEWKKRIDYGQRWQSEAAFGSFKGMFGEYVYSKNWNLIENELAIKFDLYNRLV